MKKTPSSKNKNRAKSSENRHNIKVDTGTVRILRTVGNQEAFYFYEKVGRPTGEIAKNLYDFLGKVKSVKSDCLMFHYQRKDFQNWIGKVLGDSKLAEELGEISSSNSDLVRMSICRTVENRIKELRQAQPSVGILLDEESAALLPSL